MKKAAAAVLGFILLVASIILAAAAPASALDGKWTTAWECGDRSGVITCVRVSWSKQADGIGVRLEGFEVKTRSGCGKLEGAWDGNVAYGEVRPLWITPKNNINYAYDFGKEPCSFTKNLSNAGKDGGRMDFRFNAKARVDFGGDHKVFIGWTLKPGGGYVKNYSFTEDV